ncbi:MAG: D-aminoacylase [Haloarculaceae archaeon]
MSPDVLLENARVVDGTGAPWFRGSVAIDDGRIETVERGRTDDLDAAETVDLDGSVLSPGFVDLHVHSDLRLFEEPTLPPKVRQGVTTEVLGQDGFSMAPIHREGGAAEWAEHLASLDGTIDREWSWGSTAEYLDAVDAAGTAQHFGTLVGHGTVRYEVLGMSDRAPDDDELEAMADLVTAALEEGALGFSTGLVYPPQVNADTREVRTLAARLAPYGRPFVAHIRSEGRRIWDALDEFADVGAEAGVPVHLSHYKLSGHEQHGKADRANAFIEACRDRGIDFTAEQYPYTAGNTTLASVLPPWVHTGSRAETMARLGDEEARERMRRDVEGWRVDGWENTAGAIGWENVEVTDVDAGPNEAYEGMTVEAIAREREVHPVDAVCDLLVEEELEVNMFIHAMTEADVREILTNERVAVASDGLFGGRPHPRVYGTFPRVLGRYVREENLLTVEEAVRKMTSLPARVVGLESKGLVREGMDADLTVFDPTVVGSDADYETPAQYPRGIEHVLVDGEFVVREGAVTGRTPGSALRA